MKKGPVRRMDDLIVKGKRIYEGKAKILYETSDPKLLIQEFKDDATAFNAQKRGTISNKGPINNKISTVMFRRLEKRGVPTHFVRLLSEREMLVHRVRIVPIEVVIRNRTAGSLCKRLGVPEGKVLPFPSFELYLKNDALGDPPMTEGQAVGLGFTSEAQLAAIRRMALKVNVEMARFFRSVGILLVDFKLEFGVDAKGRVLLADEISPDTCRFWDAKTKEKLDKDRFRQDLGKVEQAYHEMLRRVGG